MKWALVFLSLFPLFSEAKPHSILKLTTQSAWWGKLTRQALEHSLFEAGQFPLQASVGTLTFKTPESDLPFTYRSSLLLPAQQENWDGDWIASARQTLRWETEISEAFKVSFRDSAVYHFYRTGGYLGEYGPRASRVFENRMRATAQVNLGDESIYFLFPVIFRQTKHADYQPEARYNNRWRHALWIEPELVYAFSETDSVSLAYESDTFIASDFSETYFWDSLAVGGVSVWLTLAL